MSQNDQTKSEKHRSEKHRSKTEKPKTRPQPKNESPLPLPVNETTSEHLGVFEQNSTPVPEPLDVFEQKVSSRTKSKSKSKSQTTPQIKSETPVPETEPGIKKARRTKSKAKIDSDSVPVVETEAEVVPKTKTKPVPKTATKAKTETSSCAKRLVQQICKYQKAYGCLLNSSTIQDYIQEYVKQCFLPTEVFTKTGEFVYKTDIDYKNLAIDYPISFIPILQNQDQVKLKIKKEKTIKELTKIQERDKLRNEIKSETQKYFNVYYSLKNNLTPLEFYNKKQLCSGQNMNEIVHKKIKDQVVQKLLTFGNYQEHPEVSNPKLKITIQTPEINVEFKSLQNRINFIVMKIINNIKQVYQGTESKHFSYNLEKTDDLPKNCFVLSEDPKSIKKFEEQFIKDTKSCYEFFSTLTLDQISNSQEFLNKLENKQHKKFMEIVLKKPDENETQNGKQVKINFQFIVQSELINKYNDFYNKCVQIVSEDKEDKVSNEIDCANLVNNIYEELKQQLSVQNKQLYQNSPLQNLSKKDVCVNMSPCIKDILNNIYKECMTFCLNPKVDLMFITRDYNIQPLNIDASYQEQEPKQKTKLRSKTDSRSKPEAEAEAKSEQDQEQ